MLYLDNCIKNNVSPNRNEFIESLNSDQSYIVHYENEDFTIKFTNLSNENINENKNEKVRKVSVYNQKGELLISLIDVIKFYFEKGSFINLNKDLRVSCEANNIVPVKRTIGSMEYR
jgi:hypothetical protein